MARYIDADRLSDSLTKVMKQLTDKGISCTDLRLFKLAIDEEPTADVAPVEHGHWVAMNDDGRGYADEFGCTNCSCVVKYGHFTKGCNYERCPYCGATMDEVEE